jgi:hypothetical protein
MQPSLNVEGDPTGRPPSGGASDTLDAAGADCSLPQGFRLTKPNGDHAISAACEVWSHPDGWELRMVIDGHDLLLATVEGSAPKMLARVEKWRAPISAPTGSDSWTSTCTMRSNPISDEVQTDPLSARDR